MYIQKEITTFVDKIKDHFFEHLLPRIKDSLLPEINFLKEFNKLSEAYWLELKNKTNISEEYINNMKISYHRESFDLISAKYNDRIKQNFDQSFREFADHINAYLDTISEDILKLQSPERFEINEKDSFKIKFFKQIKRFLYAISKLPVNIINIFRKLLNKPLKEKEQWYHRIPLRNLTAFYLRDYAALKFLPVIEEVNTKVAAAFLEAWEVDEQLSRISVNKIEFHSGLKSHIENLEILNEYLNRSYEKIFGETELLFEDAFEKAGTIELPYNRFLKRNVDKTHDLLNKEYELLNNGWSNTFFSLFEDWRLNKELYSLAEKFIYDINDLKIKSGNKINEAIYPRFREIQKFLEEMINNFKEFSGSSSEVKSLIYKEKGKINKKLSTNIPEIIEIILTQNIPDLTDQMEYNVNSGINNLSEKRAIVKVTTYDKRIKDSEIDFISPKEIITYSTLPSYLKTSAVIKSSIMKNLNEIQKGLKDIDQIADFNLESALSMFGSEKNTSEDPLDIAVEGVNRAILKVKAVEENLKEVELIINKALYEAVQKVNENLVALTKNENVFEIKLSIAKTKALLRTEELKRKTIKFIKNFLPILVNEIKKIFVLVKSHYVSVKYKFGLAQHPVSISTEVSDFLAATENAISRLPFVYQRLFSVEPLVDERFFEGREKELAKLNTAYSNWNLNKYAPVIVFGEKGSGITTLLNFYLKKLASKYNIIRMSVERNIFTEKDFLNFLNILFKTNTFTNIDEVIIYLNSLVNKQIVVIENLQNLFIKKVGGFTCLKLLYELISKTSRNVFWIISSNLYAWEYLTKVINISDYFGYRVKLEKLNDNQMIDIILKRHRISGYNIYFEPGNKIVKKNLTPEEIQEHLKAEFFSELNEFAKSNISLALLYWMRSTKEVTSDTIKIGSVIDLDFSFLKIMSQEKIFILYLLLLHDGLNEEEIMLITDKSLKEVRLYLMVLFDDGIIIRRGDSFIINPLLYRHIVYLLQSKNIIH